MDDWEMWEMRDEVPLSSRERLTLVLIEAELSRDRGFARRMGAAPREVWLPLAVALLAVASLFVAVMGVRTSDTGLLWCFAVLWPLTLCQAFRLLCRAARPRPGSTDRATPWM
ncbi:DUF3040 domain-containing protein [Streptomyces sp. NPDC001606]